MITTPETVRLTIHVRDARGVLSGEIIEATVEWADGRLELLGPVEPGVRFKLEEVRGGHWVQVGALSLPVANYATCTPATPLDTFEIETWKAGLFIDVLLVLGFTVDSHTNDAHALLGLAS